MGDGGSVDCVKNYKKIVLFLSEAFIEEAQSSHDLVKSIKLHYNFALFNCMGRSATYSKLKTKNVYEYYNQSSIDGSK
jgi:hypothetical protein